MINMKNLSAKDVVISVLTIMLVLFLISFVYLWQSSSFSFAKKFLRNNNVVASQLGEVEFVYPSIVNMDTGTRNSMSYARFGVSVIGSKQSGAARFDMSGNASGWTIISAILETSSGEKTDLTPVVP